MRDRVTQALAIGGVALIAFALLWHFSLSQRWTQRIPPGWSVEYDYVGTQTFAAPGATTLPIADEPGRYERRQRVIDDRRRPTQVVIEDSYVVRRMDSDTIVFEYVTRDTVDPATGAYLSPAYRGDILLFPRNAQKRTYSLRSNYVKGIPLAYEHTDEVEGLQTFVYSYAGPAEYTESFAGTAVVPGIPVEKGQEIRCADDGFRYRTWVEPATGAIVKVEESCTSGDSVTDIATGKKLYPLDRWSGVTAGRALFARAEQVRALRAKYLLTARYVPAGFALAGLLLFAAAARRWRQVTA